jgi:hypothetical protein
VCRARSNESMIPWRDSALSGLDEHDMGGLSEKLSTDSTVLFKSCVSGGGAEVAGGSRACARSGRTGGGADEENGALLPGVTGRRRDGRLKRL